MRNELLLFCMISGYIGFHAYQIYNPHGVPVNKFVSYYALKRLIWKNLCKMSSVCHFRGSFNVNHSTAY